MTKIITSSDTHLLIHRLDYDSICVDVNTYVAHDIMVWALTYILVLPGTLW